VLVALQGASSDVSPLVRAAARRIDLSHELTVIDAGTGQTARGGDAILTLLDALPGGRVLRPWWADRPFVRLVRLGYRAVAARRSWLAGLGFDAPKDDTATDD
jgi:predicted DCC family thiol-disulfide oxidoreductase YuxK